VGEGKKAGRTDVNKRHDLFPYCEPHLMDSDSPRPRVNDILSFTRLSHKGRQEVAWQLTCDVGT
jgi:hypothetical protein